MESNIEDDKQKDEELKNEKLAKSMVFTTPTPTADQEEEGGQRKKITAQQQGMKDNWKKNQSGFSSMPREKLVEWGKTVGAENFRKTKGKTYELAVSLCKDCEMKYACPRAFENYYYHRKKYEEALEDGNTEKLNLEKWKNYTEDRSKCVYELEKRSFLKEKGVKDYNAFVSLDPKDLLAKIKTVYDKIEKMVDSDPSYTKLTGLYYMLTNLYKMKYSDRTMAQIQINQSISTSNTSKDIKEIMAEIRKEATTETAAGTQTTAVSVMKRMVLADVIKAGGETDTTDSSTETTTEGTQNAP